MYEAFCYRERHEKAVCVVHIPDLAFMIFDFCDEGTLLKLTLVDTFLRKQLMNT